MEEDFSNETEFDEVETYLSRQITFYIFLLIDIPSILCSLLLFYNFLHFHNQFHQHPSNRMLISLLIVSFLINIIDIPMIIAHCYDIFYIESMSAPGSFCIFWLLYDYILYSLYLWLMALSCFERYLMIFYKHLITRNRLFHFLLYYITLLLTIIFPLIWYIYLILIYPCEQNSFDYTQMTCEASCYEIVGDTIIENIDWILANLLPIFLVILFILIIIIRVVYQKYKISRNLMQRRIWKRTRKMFLQLLPIGFLFLLFNIPVITVGMLGIYDPWFNTIPYYYANLFEYFLPLLMPFAILSKQKQIQKQFVKLLKLRRTIRIQPFGIETS
ncbi:hypothetical protein I4U23_016392 [Adineta vaga]|nr:hypothetical protein I4U23_016392 [Adineta vaga]